MSTPDHPHPHPHLHTHISSYNQVVETVNANYDKLLHEIRALKPHMYEVSKTLLRLAPVSVLAFIETLRATNTLPPSPDLVRTQLPKLQSIIAQEDEDHSIQLDAPDKTESFIDPAFRVDTSLTDGEEIFTLNIFQKQAKLDLDCIESAVLAFAIIGVDLLFRTNNGLLQDLQHKFLQKNLSPVLNSSFLEESEEVSLFRQQPILPKRLLMDFVEKLDTNSTEEILRMHSVAKDVVSIWIVTMLGDLSEEGVEDSKLFIQMANLFHFSVQRAGNTFKFFTGTEGFEVTTSRRGYSVTTFH